MSEEKVNLSNLLKLANGTTEGTELGTNSAPQNQESLSKKPADQLTSGLLGWYSACSSNALKDGQLYFFSIMLFLKI